MILPESLCNTQVNPEISQKVLLVLRDFISHTEDYIKTKIISNQQHIEEIQIEANLP